MTKGFVRAHHECQVSLHLTMSVCACVTASFLRRHNELPCQVCDRQCECVQSLLMTSANVLSSSVSVSSGGLFSQQVYGNLSACFCDRFLVQYMRITKVNMSLEVMTSRTSATDQTKEPASLFGGRDRGTALQGYRCLVNVRDERHDALQGSVCNCAGDIDWCHVINDYSSRRR